METKKWMVPVAALASSVIAVVLFKNKTGTAKAVTNAAQAVSSIANESEKMFGGITKSTIDEIVNNTHRGVKAVINGNTLEYWYKSNSGKPTNMVRLILNETGEVTAYLGNGPYFYANSPRIFTEKLIAAMQNIQ